MLSIFYNCYPNEITYSWFARYSHINGNITSTFYLIVVDLCEGNRLIDKKCRIIGTGLEK